MALFIVVRGRAGTGKTEVSRGLVDALGFSHVDYDAAMMSSYRAYAGGSGMEAVRDLSRREGRLAAGFQAEPLLAAGRSVAVDADLRDAGELGELVSAAGLEPSDPRLLVVSLQADRKTAFARRVRPDWDEYRAVGRSRAVRAFEALWTYPLQPIAGERVVSTENRTVEQVLEAVCTIIRDVGWETPVRRDPDKP